MLIDIVGKYSVFISFKPEVEIILLKQCSRQLLTDEINKLKQYLCTDPINQENKLQIYNLMNRINEELQNRINQKVVSNE